MTADLLGWHDEDTPDHRRRLRNAMLVSVAVHGSLFAAFAIAPPATMAPMPQVLAVELVSGPPAGRRAPRAQPAPPRAPEPPPPEPPAPEPPAPAPPIAKAPVQVLPEETPGRIRKVEPEPAPPKELAKVEPKPKPPTPPTRPRREEELSYDAAMAELGLDETEEFLEALPGAQTAEESSGEPQAPMAGDRSQAGAVISPELAAWNLAVQRRIKSKWVTPSNFRGRGLATQLELRLSASGGLIGKPEVVGSSGDPFFDDNAVRAVLTVAPLPPPPEPGRRIFLFRSEAN